MAKAKPRNLVTDQTKPVTTGQPPSPDSIAAAGIVPQIDPTNSPEIGTRPLGQNSTKPFKVGG